ncbi:eukaryotic translation initiation factor 5B-like [Portunus trituberculatus]|uniref:eukaryotic translation initiation factor 5B-like n=1 Tax=Portunus trituberculatus TaxID=210409 RepID=UPI001E1CED38|nr:eukaryotic translation initiation factor 5B-like [Portunus trituberculatus]
MGKKKGNKSETNGELDDLIQDIENVTPKEAGKKGKKVKKKGGDWEDDVLKDLEDMTLEEGGGARPEEPEEAPPEKKKKEKKSKAAAKKESDDEEEMIRPTMGGGFAALMDDNDDLGDDDEVEVEPSESKTKKDSKKKKKEEAAEPVKAAPEDDKGKKGKKKKGKKKDDDEEDLDKILAELESEYKGEKPKEEIKETKMEDAPVPEPVEEDSGKKKKKKRKDQPEEPSAEVSTPPADEATEEAADDEKKDDAKAKKKKKKKETPEATPKAGPSEAKEGTATPQEDGEAEAEGEGASKKKKKKKKGEKDEEEDPKAKKGKPNKKMLAAMKEMLAKQKEQEEKLRAEEEERQRKEEERLRQIEEEKRLEQEKKERKKQKEKERKERLKAEGKLLTPKQKQDMRRAQGLLEYLKAQGVSLPEAGEKRPRPGTRVRPKKKKEEKPEEQEEQQEQPQNETEKMETEESKGGEEEVADSWDQMEEEEEEEEDVKDAWDETDDDEEEEEEEEDDTSEATKASLDTKKSEKDDDNEDEDDESEEESDSEDSEDERQTEAEKRKQRALMRIAKRKEESEKKLTLDDLRAPVVCVLGHVDHGKTKILDKLRRTNVQEGEVGGITQQIGATNVPTHGIQRQTHMVKDFDMGKLKFPGLLIIDTPGHESFSNLRSRGSSLCDIAILVVDITQGLEPQTIESINLLKKKKTPFVVALNKVDRVFEWVSNPSKDIREIIKMQKEPSKNDFERRCKEIVQGLNIQGLNAALFWENPDARQYVSLVPTSAISGDGMGNLIALVCDMCQQRLSRRLMFNEELQCTVLEVKTIQGHGTTIDVILINGRLREGDTIILAGTEGPIVTQIRSLLLPKPLKEIRVKGQYDEFKEIAAAQGVKIAARDLEKAIAGLNLQVAYHEDEVELLKEEVDKEFKAAMRSIKVKERGVYVQASTLGALEALLEFFKANSVPYSGIRVGPVVKRDVMRAAAMLEHDPMYAVILAFDVKVEKDAQELADKEGVKIFSEETIYHLGDRYVEYIKEYKKKKQDEFRSVAVFPCKLKIIPTAIFNKRDPIVLGVTVDVGILRTGTPLCVPSKEFVEIGIVTSMEFDHKNVDLAKKGVDVCIKIEPVPGNTPKLFGRHFESEDVLVSKISRESINACKDYFRDDLSKGDWKLMAELKKEFQIL